MIPRLVEKDDALDLEWRAGFSCVAYEQPLGFRTSDPSLLASLKKICPPGTDFSQQPAEVKKLYSVYQNGTELKVYDDEKKLHALDLDAALETMRKGLEFFVSSESGTKIFVHAGAVSLNGCAIVIPGRTFTGKTTLVRALLDEGALLYSDEFAVFDPEGWLHPFPRLLTIRDEKGQHERRASVEELNAEAATEPTRVGLILATRYAKTAHWRPRRLTPGKASLELLSNTVAARKYPAQALSIFQKVTTEAVTLKGSRPDVEKAVQSVKRAIRKYAR